MPGHLLLPDSSNVAPLELQLLAATASSAWWIIGVAFALVACGLTYGYLHRQKKTAAPPAAAASKRTLVRSPFDELVDAHKLDNKEVSLLRQAVQQLEVALPILLFVDPTLLARFCKANPEAEALRQKLFDLQAEAEQPDSDSIDQPCSDLQAESSEVSQAETEPGASIDSVAANLLGDLPSASASDSAQSSATAATEQPVGAAVVS